MEECPASLLFMSWDECRPLNLDPDLFARVGGGVGDLLETQLTQGAQHQTKDLSDREREPCNNSLSPQRSDEEQPVTTPSIFDAAARSEPVSVRSSLTLDLHSLDPRVAMTVEEANATTSSTSKDHNAVSVTVDNIRSRRYLPSGDVDDSHQFHLGTVHVALDLPELGIQPNSILETCCLVESLKETYTLTSSTSEAPVPTSSPSLPTKPARDISVQSDSQMWTETWRAAGKPTGDDSLANKEEGGEHKNEKRVTMLAWEHFNVKLPVKLPKLSPFVSESSAAVFDAVYRRHTKDAFSLNRSSEVVSHRGLVQQVFLLIQGTPSALFGYNATKQAFELTPGQVRIEGCSETSITRLLEQFLAIGTHMRRLIHVADLCIHHPEGMGLIRIAFGRALWSYLSMLQSTLLTMQDEWPNDSDGFSGILELCECTREMSITLERLATLCCCHISQDMNDDRVSRFGFYLPHGAGLLTLLFDHIDTTPCDDALWSVLLTSILEQTSQPYCDMLSRWLGISPESNDHDSPNDPSIPQIETSQGSMVTATRTRERPTTFQFGDHIHRHLQGLDSFSEFFVRSKSEWVFEGSHPLLLRDGEPEFGMSLSEMSHEGRGLKSWDEEFQLNESCPPAVFISNDLAQKVLDAGKALQMMLEYDAQHPLSIATSMKPFRWVFSQKELKGAHQQREEHWRTIMLKMADRLQTKGILTDQSQSMDLDLPADSVSPLPAENMMMFIEQPGPLQAKTDFPNYLGDEAHDSYWDPFSHRGELGAFFNYNSMPDASSETTQENTGIHTMGVLLGLTDTQEQEDPQHQQQEYALLPMAVQAQECISYPLKAHVAMIDTCFVSFFFHDMHVLDHWRVMGRFMLMRDGVFVSRLSEALFDDEHGFLEQQLVKATEYDRRQHGDSGRRKTGAPWPPRGGELEAALRTVLLDSIQATDPTSSLQANDLDEILAFAVKEYDTHTPICRDIHATEALDFLYLDYRPPRPVQMLILQPQIMEKYTRLFTFHLRLLRVHASMRQCFRHLRTLSSLSLAPGKRQSRPQSHVSALKAADLQFLQLFRYEAEQVLEGLRGYLFDTAVGANWVRFMKQMEMTKHQIEAQLLAKCTPIHNRQCASAAAAAASEHQKKFPKSYNMNEKELEEGDLDDDSVVVDDGTKDCLDSLSAIQQSHEQVLEHMLVQALLKRKQRPLLKVVHEVLGCMVQLGKLVRELLQTLEEAAAAGALPKAKNGDEHSDEDMEEEDTAVKASLLDASIQETMQKVRAQHERFQSACTMLMRVLKALDAQMAAGSSSSFSTSTDSQTSFLKQLMARLGWM